jgi:epsilon-lactone hydrolase
MRLIGDRLSNTRLRVELARGHLLYGEWLRREGQRGAAREHLHTAHQMLNAMSVAAFAERARRELLATGEKMRTRSPATIGSLTAQEAQIARLVRQGLSNPEVGTRLFLSPRTVEWHLGNIFTKVGVSSRRQLRDVNLDAVAPRVPTPTALASATTSSWAYAFIVGALLMVSAAVIGGWLLRPRPAEPRPVVESAVTPSPAAVVRQMTRCGCHGLHSANRPGGEAMSKEQKLALDAVLSQGELDMQADVPTLRATFNELMARIPVPDDVQQSPTTIGGVGGIEVTVRGADADPDGVILYFHGGVYVIGTAAATVPLVGDLARRTGTRAITLDYRLAPEHPYPAAVADAQDAYQGLLAQGVDAGQIALAGESAGGGLAVATLLALRDADVPLPSCAFLMSPYADLTLSGDSIADREAVDRTLTPEGLRLRIPDYVAGADASDPLISPVFADLTGLPPLLIQVGSNEILLSDALRLAERAAMADVTVTLDVTDSVPHVFQAFAAMLDEADAALDRASTFLRTNLAAAERLGTA